MRIFEELVCLFVCLVFGHIRLYGTKPISFVVFFRLVHGVFSFFLRLLGLSEWGL